MASLAMMFPLLLATGFSFEARNISTQNALVATFLVLYTFAYSWGAGIVPFLYSSEIFPQVLREVGMGWSSCICFLGAGILAITVPLLIHAIGQTAVLGIFAALNSLALLLVWLFVPGTERHIVTMEEMNYVFGVATRKHMRYQRDEVGPWFWQKYVRMKREVKEPGPLYDYARGGVS
ncbi:MAG: hypothetical protein HETSPECPRED_010028 [Heterodermia speciosa]|uniref:Major facilitator superfamily (MFS) profile domain-containing protein n=1 Tax=Heterodermia speciosa TaxID=116794 RepID=A0A8H3IZA1_9LECA|nr:MAG: hypothetical protein HETSPECPRED_010028 [Heterodermia speciosa]